MDYFELLAEFKRTVRNAEEMLNGSREQREAIVNEVGDAYHDLFNHIVTSNI